MRTVSVWLDRLDAFLGNSGHLFLAVFLLSIFWYFSLLRYNAYDTTYSLLDVVVSVSLASFTVWFYLSSRKYGFVDTVRFCIYLPLYGVSAVVVSLSPSEKPVQKIGDYSDLIRTFSTSLDEAVNDVYAGKVVECYADTVNAYAVCEAPYGIRIPVQETISRIAPNIHVSEANIVASEITGTKTEFIVTPKGLAEYDDYVKLCMPWDGLPEIMDRIFLRMKPRITRRQPSVPV
jgi:hypothetical protein